MLRGPWHRHCSHVSQFFQCLQDYRTQFWNLSTQIKNGFTSRRLTLARSPPPSPGGKDRCEEQTFGWPSRIQCLVYHQNHGHCRKEISIHGTSPGKRRQIGTASPTSSRSTSTWCIQRNPQSHSLGGQEKEHGLLRELPLPTSFKWKFYTCSTPKPCSSHSLCTFHWSPMPTCWSSVNFSHCQSTSIFGQCLNHPRHRPEQPPGYWTLQIFSNYLQLWSAFMPTPSFAREEKWWRQVWKSLA